MNGANNSFGLSVYTVGAGTPFTEIVQTYGTASTFTVLTRVRSRLRGAACPAKISRIDIKLRTVR